MSFPLFSQSTNGLIPVYLRLFFTVITIIIIIILHNYYCTITLFSMFMYHIHLLLLVILFIYHNFVCMSRKGIAEGYYCLKRKA